MRAVSVIYQLRFVQHQFGASYGGLIVLLNQITFYILLAELGLAAATTSLLFEPVHSGEATRVRALMLALRKDVYRIAYWLAPISCVAVVGLSFWLKQQVPLGVLAPSLLLTCASALLTFLALPYQSMFNATDRVPLRNFVLGCGFGSKVLAGILLARVMHSFVGLPLGTALVGGIELAVQHLLIMPRVVPAEVSAVDMASASTAIRTRGKFVLFHRIGYLVSYQSDYIILLLASSLSLLGYYAQYQYIYAGLLSFALAVGGTLTAKTARRQLSLGKAAFGHIYRQTTALCALAAVACAVGYDLFTPTAIRLLYHSQNVDVKVVLLFAILLLLNILKMNDDLWIDTTGAYRTGFYLPLLEASTYIGLGFVLVHRFGIEGILYAAIFTNILFSVIFKAFVIGRGVLERQLRSTLLIKMTSLVAVCVLFSLFVSLAHSLMAFHFTR